MLRERKVKWLMICFVLLELRRMWFGCHENVELGGQSYMVQASHSSGLILNSHPTIVQSASGPTPINLFQILLFP